MEEVKLEKDIPLQTSDHPHHHHHQQQQQQQSQQNADKKTQQQSQSPHQLHRPLNQLKPEDAGDASRSSLSSIESIEVVHVRTPKSLSSRGRRHRGRGGGCGGTRSTIRYLRHGLLAVSVILFITGFLLTVLGFVDVSLTPVQRLPMQVVGPACLVATLAVAVLGVIFLRLWRTELRRQRRDIELRTRAQLQAMASDLLDKRRSSSSSNRHHQTLLTSEALQDPHVRRQLMLQMRRQSAVDVSGGSRRSSRAAAATRSRHSSVTSALLRQQANLHTHRKSTDTAISLGSGSRSTGRRRYTSGCGDVPGIEISRIDTLDFDDGSLLATCSGKRGCGGSGSRQRFIFINSDGSSGDCSRLSFLGGGSEYSLSASRSSRSRSSHDSSSNSRVWDFSSPRESDWDVQCAATAGSVGGVGGGGGLLGGPSTVGGSGISDVQQFAGHQSLLSPGIPRPGVGGRSGSTQVVTFDISQPSARRHSSPAPSARRRDSIAITIPAACTDYQLNGSAATGVTDGYLSRGPGTSPTDFRPPASAVNGAETAKNGRDIGVGNVYVNRFCGTPEEAAPRPSSATATAAAAAFRRKSCSGEQSLLSVAIDEADTDTEDGTECSGERSNLINHASGAGTAVGSGDVEVRSTVTGGVPGMFGERRRTGSLKRSNVAETVEVVERRMAKIFDDMSYMTIDEALDQKTSMEAGALKCDHRLASLDTIALQANESITGNTVSVDVDSKHRTNVMSSYTGTSTFEMSPSGEGPVEQHVNRAIW